MGRARGRATGGLSVVLVLPARRRSLSYAFVRGLVAPAVRGLYRLEVRGVDRVPRAGPFVVVANHLSVLDPFVLGTAVPRPLRFLAKEELWRWPCARSVLDDLGGIPVARGRGDLGAMRLAEEALAAGEAVALFPEGAVRRGGPWLRGVARLALATGAPILPVRIIGTDEALRPGRVGFPRVAVLIGSPVAVDRARATVVAARELTARLEHAVGALGR